MRNNFAKYYLRFAISLKNSVKSLNNYIDSHPHPKKKENSYFYNIIIFVELGEFHRKGKRWITDLFIFCYFISLRVINKCTHLLFEEGSFLVQIFYFKRGAKIILQPKRVFNKKCRMKYIALINSQICKADNKKNLLL